MACLDDIVTLGICDDPGTSGLTLMMAAGMSPKNLENIASEQYVQGAKLAKMKKKLAITMLRNDFIGVLQGNNIATTLADPIYNTSTFIPSVDKGFYPGARGVTIHANNAGYRGRLKKRKIVKVQCYPLTSGAGEILISETIGGITTTTPYTVTFVANAVNTFTVSFVSGSDTIRVLIDNSTINFCSSNITCMKGCNNSMPNPCAWADGWDGTAAVKSEGFGLNVQFLCHCDYDQLLCDMSTSYIGELIWLKWQELIYDEQYKTNRFESWVIYNREDIKETYLPEIRAQYAIKWNELVGGALFNILQNYRDDCLNCRGIRQLTNI